MKTITVTTFKRPHYLEKMLYSLLQNDLTGWKIYFSIEPSEHVIEIQNLITQALIESQIDYHLKVNKEILGIEENPYSALEYVFKLGSTVNIYLEEDIIVSPDVTKLADWYMSQDMSQLMCLNLLYGICGGKEHQSIDIPNLVCKTKNFNSLGFIITHEQYNKYFKPYWFDYNHSFKIRGWDWAVFAHNLRDKNQNLFVLQPLLSRAKHIGRVGGIFATPEFHDKTFSQLRISNYNKEIEYQIIETCEKWKK